MLSFRTSSEQRRIFEMEASASSLSFIGQDLNLVPWLKMVLSAYCNQLLIGWPMLLLLQFSVISVRGYVGKQIGGSLYCTILGVWFSARRTARRHAEDPNRSGPLQRCSARTWSRLGPTRINLQKCSVQFAKQARLPCGGNLI